MERASRYFSRNEWAKEVLNEIPAYVLARIKGEAVALAAARSDDGGLSDQASIVIGYVEAFPFYAAGEFPWGHVVDLLDRMRTIIALSKPVIRIFKAPRSKAPKEPETQAAKEAKRVMLYEGRWVSKIWYARHVKQAA